MGTRRAVGVTEFGGPQALQVVELPMQEPGPGEVTIRVAAAAVNPTDTVMRAGVYRSRLDWDPPYVPGMDAAGTVETVGEGVDLRPGAQVMSAVLPVRPEGGAYSELVTVPAAQVIAIPHGASLQEAATLPMNGLTAYAALEMLGLQSGQTLGVTGAAGVLGSYAIALAKHRGLRVIADAKAEDEELVRGFGADEIIERGEGVGQRLRDASDGGVDGLLDGAVQHTAVLDGIRDGGAVAAIRPFDGELGRGIRLEQVWVTRHLDDRDGLELLRDLAGRGAIQLRVADTYPPDRAPEAHERFERGGVRGRLLITF